MLGRQSPPHQAIVRAVEVRFDRPFAVVASWRGLPAFWAWVTEPMEPSEPKESARDA
jgi:hypothetical protein